MSEPNETPASPVLSSGEAKKRFFFYLVLKLGGLGALFAGVLMARGGITILSGILFVAGAASLFIRPRTLGLTTRPER
jgi:hypothetical protein